MLSPTRSPPVDAECVLQVSLRPLTLKVPAALPPGQSAHIDASGPVDTSEGGESGAGNGRNSRRAHRGPARRSFISVSPLTRSHPCRCEFRRLMVTTRFEGEVGDCSDFSEPYGAFVERFGALAMES